MKDREKILILILIPILLLFVHIISAAEEPPNSDYIPPVPSNLSNIQGNFWINYTWQAGTGNKTDSYNVSVNGTWTNGTINTYYNSTVVPHGWSNITVWAYNNSGNGSLSSISVSQDIQLANNAPFQYLIGNKVVNENENLQFNVTATDADFDQITYGTNATKGTFNATTGNFSWTPAYGDAGVYFWYFNSGDGFGGISTENIAVTVSNVPLSITSSSPAGDTTTIVGTSQAFGITLNRTASVTWYINGSIVEMNPGVVSSNYTNSTAGIGEYKVTGIANDGYYSASRTWNWTVIKQPEYNVSGYVFDNYGSGLGDVLVTNGSYNYTTTASGYYQITGLFNGTYNFSYSRAGFNTGYLSIIINGADNITANKTIYDTTPPASASNPGTSTGNFFINNTWTNPLDADFNYTWFRYSNGTTLQNASKSVNYLNLTWPPHYTQNISAQTVDNYSNVNQTMVWFNDTIPNNAPVHAAIGNKTVYEGQLLTFTVDATDADNDTITYGTNATKGTFNTTTGNFSWIPSYGDSGFYFWNFNSSDGYGSIANENVAVAVINVPLSITSSSPATDPATINGTAQTFGVTLNRTANVTWYINDSVVQSNLSVASANYTNYSAGIGMYNVTAIANDSYDSALRTWNWTVTPQPAYNVSGYVFDNYGSMLGGVLVQNGSSENTTLASGYYLITGLLNGTYNFSYSRPGFNTGYLEVTVNGADNPSVNATIYDTTPPASVSNATSSAGSFYINNTWTNPIDADFNHTWFRYGNGTNLQNVSSPVSYLNITWLPRYIQNISAQAVDTYGNINQTMVWFNATIPNNAPIQATIGNKIVNEGGLLAFTVSATDIDTDAITYGTNTTKGTFNTTTGEFSWIPGYGDAGTYIWYFNSSDSYGGIANEIITVTVNNVPLSITSSSPVSDPTTIVDTAQTFVVDLNRTADVTWYVNGSAIQTNSSIISASYTNSTAGIGVYNITAIISDSYDSASRTWYWTVIPKPTYNVSGYVFDIHGSGLESVQVQNNSKQSTTEVSGHYLITGLLNGTYNFSYSKAGFNTGYLEITISGSDINNANLTIYDTTPPDSVTNPATVTGSFYINNTWINPADADFSHTWLKYGNDTTLQNVSSTISHLNLTWLPHYTQNISAQTVDTYDNVNQTKVWFNVTIPNNVPVQSQIENKTVAAGDLLTFTVSATDADSDEITYGTNATKGALNSSTGVYLWTTTSSDVGTYIWSFNSADGYGGVDNETITVTVNPPPAYIPPVPSYLSSTQGNFWINHTWQEGAGNKTDSYNISVNGVWTNGTTATYSNNNVGAHGWSNISVWAYNNSGNGSLSLTSISQSTQVNNNAPVQSQIGDLIVMVGDPLTFTVSATDEDSDVITYGTNATKGTLDPLTGEYSWLTTGSDIGTYIWSFSSTDGYGGVDNEIITVTVTAQSSPTNQNMGVKDTLFADYTENMCRGCHAQGVTDYHHLLDNNKYSCSNCHPINGSQITIVRDCKTCHGNTFNNLDIRRPHHETKNAQDRHCSFCHGSIVDDFDDEHYIPTYDLSFTSPSPHYKVINYTTGNKFGGCEACHKRNDTYVPRIYYDNETHHTLGNLSGFNPQNSSKCEACHENNGLYEFDSIRYCQKCHSVKSLHNMQHDYINTSNSSGHGHIGSDRDCNGCHAFWVTADIKPAIDSIIPTVDTISTSKINAGNNTTLTINGDNFLHSANISVVILVNDTYNMTLYPDSLNDTEIAVTIPSLEKGRYGIYILKNGKVKSNRRPIISVPEAIIDSAKKSGTAISIRGSGFGYYDPAYINFTNVTITTIDKKGVVTYRRVQIDDWNDTLINIHSTDAAAGDNVTVNSVFGSNSTKVTR